MSQPPKRVNSTLAYLRKLFIIPDSPDKFIDFGNELLEMIHVFFQERGGIHSSISLPELSRIFDETAVPNRPMLIKDVFSEIRTKVINHSVKVGSPYYIGHMTSATPYFMVLLEMIIAALNQNQVKIETAKASSFVERELVAWLHRMFFMRSDAFYKKQVQNPRVALGNVTADGTVANLTALLVAREKAFPPDGDFPGLRAAGVDAAFRHYRCERGVVLVSTRGHYSIRKAANLLGLGEDNVLNVPVDACNRIDIHRLRNRVERLLRPQAKTKIVSIVGIAGTTETGNVDNLQELGEISREAGAHFHVDACWGGAALLADDYRPLFRGIESADSVTIDAHKLLYCPMSMGLVLFRNEKDLLTIRHSSQYVIRRNSVDTGRFTIEGSRPFSCLKPWASLKIIGKEGYGLLFKEARKLTTALEELLDYCGDFEILNRPELFILNYRFIPEAVRQQLGPWKKSATASPEGPFRKETAGEIRKINRLINGLNIKLHKALRRDDTTFVSRTMLESTPYRPQNIVVLRAVLINPLTTRKTLRKIVSTQHRIGRQLWRDFEPAYQRMLQN